jgi:hypothetical protein
VGERHNRLICLKASDVRKPSGTDRKFDLTKPPVFFPVSRESGGIRVSILTFIDIADLKA